MHAGHRAGNRAAKEQHIKPQAFMSNPEVDYFKLFEKLDGIDQPLGKIDDNLDVGIAGLGAAGSFGGWMLANAGAKVTAYERGKEPGGRLWSIVLLDYIIFEIGGMRFPPCETLMYLLAAHFGFGFIQDFPDPGKVATLIWRRMNGHTWNDPSNPPDMCKKIVNAFLHLEANGITKDGKPVLVSFNQLKEWAQSDDRKVRMQIQPAWQEWIKFGKHNLLLEGIQRIMGSNHEWDWPKDLILTQQDQDIWGDVGFGSGGFRDLFKCDFIYIISLLPNGLEFMQATFAKRNKDDNSLSPAPVQDLIRAICNAAEMEKNFNVEIFDVELFFLDSGKPQFKLHIRNADGSITYRVHDVVILTPTIKTDLIQKIANRRGKGQLFCDEVLEAFLKTDLIPSTKMFDVIDNFIGKVGENFPRDILSDELPGQGYTLEYTDPTNPHEHPAFLADLEHYGWKDGSTAVENMSAAELKAKVMKLYEEISKSGGELSDLVKRHRSAGGEQGLFKFDWQKDPRFNGAFVLAGKDQLRHIAAMSYDFLKMHEPDALPIFYMSDNASMTSGWFDAVRDMVNVVSAIIGRYGELYVKEEQPYLVMTKDLYTY
jgi:hypothetical protein